MLQIETFVRNLSGGKNVAKKPIPVFARQLIAKTSSGLLSNEEMKIGAMRPNELNAKWKCVTGQRIDFGQIRVQITTPFVGRSNMSGLCTLVYRHESKLNSFHMARGGTVKSRSSRHLQTNHLWLPKRPISCRSSCVRVYRFYMKSPCYIDTPRCQSIRSNYREK